MRRRSRLLRVAKWGGVVVCAVIVVTFIVSRWYWMAWTHYRGYVLINNGLAKAMWVAPEIDSWSAQLAPGADLFGTKPGLSAAPLTWPSYDFWVPLEEIWSSLSDHVTVEVPLWFPLILAGGPTTFIWCLDRRRPLPGHCPCGYDLTGNVSGTCPECGVEVQA